MKKRLITAYLTALAMIVLTGLLMSTFRPAFASQETTSSEQETTRKQTEEPTTTTEEPTTTTAEPTTTEAPKPTKRISGIIN